MPGWFGKFAKLKVAKTCDRLGMIPLIREVTIIYPDICSKRLRCLAILRYITWNPQKNTIKSAKFTLNSKRFPRLKSTFPLWLNLQSSPRYIQNGFQPSSHFFLDRKPFELVLCLLLGWTFLNYLCRRCSNALGSRGLGMLKKLFRA